MRKRNILKVALTEDEWEMVEDALDDAENMWRESGHYYSAKQLAKIKDKIDEQI
jgi:hypothetical protein